MPGRRTKVREPPTRRKRPPRRPPSKPASHRLLKPPLPIYSILAWADAHKRRTGRWPHTESGEVRAAPWETWSAINSALRYGCRGCRAGSSLAHLLHDHRGKTWRPRPPVPLPRPRLNTREILAWADEHRRQTGQWPSNASGKVHAAPWENWSAIDTALRKGTRGCRPGGSLPILLHRHRGRPLPLPRPRPRLSVRQILAWADAFHERAGRWPAMHSGRVAPDQNDTWLAVDHALRRGRRGLAGDTSLALLLLRYRAVGRNRYLPRLSIKRILVWADAHHARTGSWPTAKSGSVVGAPGENWAALYYAIAFGHRGLPRGYTLRTLLQKYRRAPFRRNRTAFTEAQILAWVDAYQRRHDRWPALNSGTIPGSGGQTWRIIDSALSKGERGLPGKESLFEFLVRHGRRPARHWRIHRARPPITIDRILAWADEYHRRHGHWPAAGSGSIAGASDGETWVSVNNALRVGLRGLTGGSSLALLLEKHRDLRHQGHRAPLTAAQILAWAGSFFGRMGRWPTFHSGPVAESPGDTWCAVDQALRKGHRGLPGGESLARLLRQHRRSVP